MRGASTPPRRRSRWPPSASPALRSRCARPSIPMRGRPQLIFAFEAAVIGGAGSLWGTLIGGIVLGVAQSIGAQIDPQGFFIAGHVVFLAVLFARLFFGGGARRPSARWLEAMRMSGRGDPRRALEPRFDRLGRRGGCVIVVALAVGPLLSRRQRDRQADDAVHLCHPAVDVERAGRLWRPGLDRPAGVLRPRRLCRGAARRRRRQRLSRAGPRGALMVGAASSLPISAFMLRLRGGEFAIGMWVVAELAPSARQSRHAGAAARPAPR